ncbi:uncharacterized protein V1510DRAFT_417721 [Dipodascopsis tothii]|uniref:uncharacterized protein n=1 Tax=Dipodascopsis tothii TaxID=44089 RepID=UPI0034CF8159
MDRDSASGHAAGADETAPPGYEAVAGRVSDVSGHTGASERGDSDSDDVLVLCHGCQNQFYVANPPAMPLVCQRCGGDFCEMIEDDDGQAFYSESGGEDDEDEEEHMHNVMGVMQIIQSVMGNNRPIRLPADGDEPADADIDDYPGMRRPQPPSSDTSRGSGPTLPSLGSGLGRFGNFEFDFSTAGVPGRGHAEVSFAPVGEDGESRRSRPPHPMEQLSRFLQQTFAGLGADGGPYTAGAGGGVGLGGAGAHGETTFGPNSEAVSQIFGRIFNVQGNPQDYAWSQSDLDQIITRLMEQTQSERVLSPAAADDISALPVVKITPEMIEGWPDCAICKDAYEVGDEVNRLPCDHFFHAACIKHWLEISDSCPICRKSISTHTDGAGPAGETGAAADTATGTATDTATTAAGSAATATTASTAPGDASTAPPPAPLD